MNTVETFDFGEPFIGRLADFIEKRYGAGQKDLSRLAVVFGGKRPSLFLKRELSRRLKAGFYPPRFFSIDEFMHFTARKKYIFQTGHDLDRGYVLYQMAKIKAPHILKGRETFAAFLPWAREILEFIGHMDLEDISDGELRNIQANAAIGYNVPPDVNRLLESLVALRSAYHRHMDETGNFSRAYVYRKAADAALDADFSEFDAILFCNFFYFNATETRLVKILQDRKLALFIFQGDESRWPILQKASAALGRPIRETGLNTVPGFRLKLYSAFDGHSQAATVREILKDIPRPDQTVIVLPDADLIIPLLAEIDPLIKDYNISMGYPLKRSSLYSLLEFIFKARLSTAEQGYYTRDLLRALRHPLIKNLDFGAGAAASRVLIHKIEDLLTGRDPGPLSGHLFVRWTDLLETEEIYLRAEETLKGMGQEIPASGLRDLLNNMIKSVFEPWESVGNFADFAAALEKTVETMLDKSFLSSYPLNLKIAEKMFALKENLDQVGFKHEPFSQEDIFKIFTGQMDREIVAFTGSPLKGLQILGLFETRSLDFENVIVLDANEGVLPRLNVFEPLIPREVLIGLGLDRLAEEEEIQRYQFMRLISSAKNVHIVYEENAKKERSRFVEELVWEEEKKRGSLSAVPVVFPGFSVKVSSRPRSIPKTRAMVDFLRQSRFSASGVNLYLKSPVEFYYAHVLGLREKEDLLDEPENRQVGTFVHALLEETFRLFVGKKPQIDDQFKIFFRKALDRLFEAQYGRGHASDAYLLKRVLDARLERFIGEEAKRCEEVEKILYIERKFEDRVTLDCGAVNFVYRVDRVDQMKDGTIMIIDYKTGGVDAMPRDIAGYETMDLSRENIRDAIVSFQIPMYYQYLRKTFRDKKINAAYYNLRTLDFDPFINEKMTVEPERVEAAFARSLNFIIEEIMNPESMFTDKL